MRRDGRTSRWHSNPRTYENRIERRQPAYLFNSDGSHTPLTWTSVFWPVIHRCHCRKPGSQRDGTAEFQPCAARILDALLGEFGRGSIRGKLRSDHRGSSATVCRGPIQSAGRCPIGQANQTEESNRSTVAVEEKMKHSVAGVGCQCTCWAGDAQVPLLMSTPPLVRVIAPLRAKVYPTRSCIMEVPWPHTS